MVKVMKSFFRKITLQIKRRSDYKKTSPEMDLSQDIARRGIRLGLIFNGMQQRADLQPPVALFTDKKTMTTFGVETGQNIKSKLIETRRKFRSFKDSKKFQIS